MAEEITQPPKWEGKASTELTGGTTAEHVWACLEDFCNAHKWLPNLDTCYQVEGVPGQPGLVRYCASSTKPSSSDDEMTIRWAKEKLIVMDPIQRCLSYEVIDNNIGIKSYVATLRVFPVNKGNGMIGCRIEWSYIADPFEGWRFEDLAAHIDHSLKFMSEKMERAGRNLGMHAC